MMTDDDVKLYEILTERLERHRNEAGAGKESLLECFDRILLDHEKYHHGADVEAHHTHK